MGPIIGILSPISLTHTLSSFFFAFLRPRLRSRRRKSSCHLAGPQRLFASCDCRVYSSLGFFEGLWRYVVSGLFQWI